MVCFRLKPYYGPNSQNPQRVLLFKRVWGDREARGLVGSKSALEKKYTSRENSQIRKDVFLILKKTISCPWKKSKNTCVKANFARVKKPRSGKKWFHAGGRGGKPNPIPRNRFSLEEKEKSSQKIACSNYQEPIKLYYFFYPTSGTVQKLRSR